ncbi:MAG: peptidoglycan editing factor PgeF [Pseudomonadota bacterium]
MTCKNILTPDWSLPKNVAAACTLRSFGNLATHVGDDPGEVILRRRRLIRQLQLPTVPRYLNQQHTDKVSIWPGIKQPSDALVANQPVAAVVLTADCLPLLLCSKDGQKIAAAHAGWRGLAAGILGQTIKALRVDAKQLQLWIGPAICQRCYQVGDEVRQAFLKSFDAASVNRAFSADQHRWLVDLPRLAEIQARGFGVTSITQSGLCTACQQQRFYSYRKNQDIGRFASIIWRKS